MQIFWVLLLKRMGHTSSESARAIAVAPLTTIAVYSSVIFFANVLSSSGLVFNEHLYFFDEVIAWDGLFDEKISAGIQCIFL